MRGKFRNSLAKPEPFVPNEPTPVNFTLQDVAHTFRAGHKIMVQIQSTWFPLVDRNPQKFVDIYRPEESDFQKATQRVYRNRARCRRIWKCWSSRGDRPKSSRVRTGSDARGLALLTGPSSIL